MRIAASFAGVLSSGLTVFGNKDDAKKGKWVDENLADKTFANSTYGGTKSGEISTHKQPTVAKIGGQRRSTIKSRKKHKNQKIQISICAHRRHRRKRIKDRPLLQPISSLTDQRKNLISVESLKVEC